MFQINSYLQFQNTPDGKPRVLVEGVNYDYIGGGEEEIQGLFKKIEGALLSIANLSDCRRLLTVEIGRECDIIVEQTCSKGCLEVYMIYFEPGTENNGHFGKMVKEEFDYKFVVDFCSISAGEEEEENYKEIESNFGKIRPGQNVVASFFDDPAKYSKILWNCSEEEGWEKIFKLLNIEK